jgi:hypothetical protein
MGYKVREEKIATSKTDFYTGEGKMKDSGISEKSERELDSMLDEIILKTARDRFKKACAKNKITEFQVCAIDPSTAEGLIQLTVAVEA